MSNKLLLAGSGTIVGSASDENCAQYFKLLSDKDSQWGITGFGKRRTSFLSKRQIISSVQRLRIYGRCFVSGSAPMNDINISDVESRLFPVFTREVPIFSRWDGSITEGFPEAKLSKKDYEVKEEIASKDAYWKQVKERYSGKGIVISIGEGGVDEVIRLLRVLRALKNTLPIQLVHKGDVSASSMNMIIQAGRGKIEDKQGIYSDISEHPQEIWFVNAARSIKKGNLDLFQRFSNKWIASLFNSFEEMILMDSDVVPFLNPKELFDATEYRETGAYFFKDRPIDEFLRSSDLSFYRKLLPSEWEYTAFEMQPLTDHTYGNGFLKHGYKHFMESGVVVLNRRNHMPGLLISATMQLWKETSQPIYGDKELFWLGQSIAGNENYRFNKNEAGAIGKKGVYNSNNIEYVCSVQPAHFDNELNLLWTNGGLRNCKKGSWNRDFAENKYLRRKYHNVEELKKYYQSPLELDGAMIAPRSHLNFFERIQGKKVGFQKCPHMGCMGYVWCAYDNPDEVRAKKINFNENSLSRIRTIVALWNMD